MKVKSKKFLFDYLNAHSPVGEEVEGQKVWINYVKQYSDEINVDSYGTAYAIKKSKTNGSDELSLEEAIQKGLDSKKIKNFDFSEHLKNIKRKRKKVVIEAHCDEIAWIITRIEPSGIIRVDKAGGSDNMIAPSKKVLIHTRSGKKVPGIFGYPAVHVRKKRTDMGSEIDELFIDCGFKSAKDAESKGVAVGNLVTFDEQLSEMGSYFVGKSLDNKIGGFIIAEVLKRLHKNQVELPYDLYVVNSVQEEVGLFGARRIAKTLQADLALVHDVCHNTDTPKYNKNKSGDIRGGEGPCLEWTAQNHRDILDRLTKIAEGENIKIQNCVGSYGNDTVSFFLENTPTAIIATPLKYMHTTAESAHRDDIEGAINLFYHTLLSIDEKWIEYVNNPISKYL